MRPNEIELAVKLNESGIFNLSAKIVVCACGLIGSTFFPGSKINNEPDRKSYIGVGAEPISARGKIPPETIFMSVGKGGYVGGLILNDDTIHIAAAISPALIAHYGEVDSAVQSILIESGAKEFCAFKNLKWRGTPALTRSGTVAAHRYFAIGDACGYVEPFTGEGITWALQSAINVAPYVKDGVQGWRPELASSWQALHAKTVGRSQRFCNLTASILRLPPALSFPIIRSAKIAGIPELLGRAIGGTPPSWI